jgi:hypothetical protein
MKLDPTLPPRTRSLIARLALYFAAHDDPALLSQCSQSDINNAIVRGLILMGSAMITMLGLAFTGYYLARSVFAILIAFVYSAFQVLLDHYGLVRSALFHDGIRELGEGGLRLQLSHVSSRVSKICVWLRGALIVVMGCVVALVSGLTLNRDAIDQRIETAYQSQNHASFDRVVKDFDARRQSTAANYNAEAELVRALSGQVSRLMESQIKAGLRSATSKTAAATEVKARQNNDELDKRLAKENAKLADLRQELEKLDTGRAQVIRNAIEADPQRIPRDESLIARIKALFDGIHADWWVAIPMALVDCLVLGWEGAFLTIKGIWLPSKYSKLYARRELEAMVEQADQTRAAITGRQPVDIREPDVARGAAVGEGRLALVPDHVQAELPHAASEGGSEDQPPVGIWPIASDGFAHFPLAPNDAAPLRRPGRPVGSKDKTKRKPKKALAADAALNGKGGEYV